MAVIQGQEVMEIEKLTKSELEILTVLWSSDRPLSRAEILDRSPKRSWKESSIHLLLNHLIEKRMIRVNGFAKSGSHYGRTYSPLLSEAEYLAAQIQQIESFQADQAGTVTQLFSALLDDSELTDETYQELERLLQEKRAQKVKKTRR